MPSGTEHTPDTTHETGMTTTRNHTRRKRLGPWVRGGHGEGRVESGLGAGEGWQEVVWWKLGGALGSERRWSTGM